MIVDASNAVKRSANVSQAPRVHSKTSRISGKSVVQASVWYNEVWATLRSPRNQRIILSYQKMIQRVQSQLSELSKQKWFVLWVGMNDSTLKKKIQNYYGIYRS